MGVKKKRMQTIIITVVTLLIVWGQSCLSYDQSQAESNAVMEIMEPIHGVDVATDNISDAFGLWNMIIRKAAHVVEYAVIGIEYAWLLFLFSEKPDEERSKFKYIFSVVVTVYVWGCFTGLLDETIQIWSGRGSLISDVWIDSAGALLGAVLAQMWVWFRTLHQNA